MTDRLPVHVLTGFLGSGKTTLLNRLLATDALAKSAVIVNEFGDIALDHLLVERSDDNLVELAGGCVCCTVRADLARTMAMLLARRDHGGSTPFERFVIETTGLADPNPILNLLSTDPLLAERTRRGTMVATVDAVNGAATLARHDESVRQVVLADRLVITKSDLAGSGLRQTLHQLNPGAEVIDASAATADLLSEHTVAAELESASASAHEHQHTQGIQTFTVHRRAPLAAAVLPLLVTLLAEQLGASLLRVKGLVALRECPAVPVVVQGAQHVFQPLDTLPAWPPGWAPETRLVFIVQGDARAFVEAALDALIAEVAATERHLRQETPTCSI